MDVAMTASRTHHATRRWTAPLPQLEQHVGVPIDAPTDRLPLLVNVVGAESRVVGVDAARGLALLGMIAVHTLPVAAAGGLTTVGLVAGGTSAALFGVLVGVSVALLTGRRRVLIGGGAARVHAARLAVRGLAVGVLGLALGEAGIGSVDIILTYYGVLFFLAVPLIVMPTRVLFTLGGVLAVVAPVTSFVLRRGLAPVELVDPSFSALGADPGGLLTALFFTGAYPAWPWLAYLCIGIAVGRCALSRARTAALVTLTGVVLVAIAGIASHVALEQAGGLAQILADPGLPPDEVRAALTEGPDGVTPTTTWWWLAVDTAHSSTPFDLARTIGTSLTALGAMLIVDRALEHGRGTSWARAVRTARSPLAAAGAMTLTLYSLHVIVAGTAVDSDPWTLYLTQVVAALLIGLLWRRWVGRGPLEGAVGRLVDAVVPAPRMRDVPSRPARVTPGRAALVGALVLFSVVGGAFAVAADRTVDVSVVPTSEPDAGGASDSRPDTGPDSGPDTGADSGPDTGPDSGPDTGPDSGPDTGPDSGPDTGPDSGGDGAPGTSGGGAGD